MDTNDDSKIDISDAIYILNFLFSGGNQPLTPYPDFGVDNTDDDFGCIGDYN